MINLLCSLTVVWWAVLLVLTLSRCVVVIRLRTVRFMLTLLSNVMTCGLGPGILILFPLVWRSNPLTRGTVGTVTGILLAIDACFPLWCPCLN